MKKVYIVGICGRTMSSLAVMLKKEGWQVSGSDQNAYPPATTFLEAQGIKFHLGYDADLLPEDVDLVIVGGNAYHVVNSNPEVERAGELDIKVQSYPEFFHDWLEKEESIVVAGTYGKTTICAMLSWIMEVAGYSPAFDIAELPANFDFGTRNLETKYSIIHGDEHPTLGYSNLPKFAYFDPRYLILSAVMWDHFNVYPTEESYKQVFKDLATKVRKDGWILYCLEGMNNEDVARVFEGKSFNYSYNNDQANYYAKDVKYDDGQIRFELVDKKHDEVLRVETEIFGKANIENAVGAMAAAKLLGVSGDKIQEAMRSYKGLKRHLEKLSIFNIEMSKNTSSSRVGHAEFFSSSDSILNQVQNDEEGAKDVEKGGVISFYLDQGQHPQKARGAVEALKDRFPDDKLIVVFDPHASVLHDKESLNWYEGAFDKADEVIIGGLKTRRLAKGESKHDRVTGKKVLNAIKIYNKNVKYLPVNKQIVDYLKSSLKGGEKVLFLSTGRFGGLIEEVVKEFKD